MSKPLIMSKPQQTTQHILMIKPIYFGFNEETAANNAFQTQDYSLTKTEIRQKALEEFEAFTALLKASGVQLMIIDPIFPQATDAVFPNNWISFHDNGTIITYPMFAPSRRIERQESIIEQIEDKFVVTNRIHYEDYEDEEMFLEGTGSMIFDRVHRIVYACLSPRTHKDLLDKFCQWSGYKKVVFTAKDAEGIDIYHTNVMMAIGETFAVICLDALPKEEERLLVKAELERTSKEVIDISLDQMSAFAGNMLQVRNQNDDTFLVMSEQAYDSLDRTTQVLKLHAHTSILYSSLDTIEKYGGGSARCMMAEIFLPEKIPAKKTTKKRGRKPSKAVKTLIEKYVPGEGWIKVQG